MAPLLRTPKRSSVSSSMKSNRAAGTPASCAKLRSAFAEPSSPKTSRPFLVQVADQLFRGAVLEEKIFAVTMLQGIVGDFGKPEFKLFESWLDRVGTWADHDALVHYLIGPMIAADDSLLVAPAALGEVEEPLASAGRRRQPDPQHAPAQELRAHSTCDRNAAGQRRRHGAEGAWAGCCARLRSSIRSRLSIYLMTIRERTPRLVLRTACETLPNATREKVLKK